jgi:hypothetical protein
VRTRRFFLLGLFMVGVLPTAALPTAAQQRGVAPVLIRVPTVGIEAQVAPAQIRNYVTDEPKTAWVVCWYEEIGRLGVPGNVIMAGNYDFWDIPASVFYNLVHVDVDDGIEVVGEDGMAYRFRVSAVETYDRDSVPLDKLFGTTGAEKKLTLFTAAPPFDYSAEIYQKYLFVTANQTSESVRPAATSAATLGATPDASTSSPACGPPQSAGRGA